MMLRMKKRITISVEPEVVEIARDEVEAGRAPNVSAAIEDAVVSRMRSRALREALELSEAEHGPIGEEAMEWARKEMTRVRAERRKRRKEPSSSMRER
jgi:Arc/MetJ-type ribon-helix-helix transcriptional regulator